MSSFFVRCKIAKNSEITMKKYWKFRDYPVLILADDEMEALKLLRKVTQHCGDVIQRNLQEDPSNKAVEKTYTELFTEPVSVSSDGKVVTVSRKDSVSKETPPTKQKDTFTNTVEDILTKVKSKKFVN